MMSADLKVIMQIKNYEILARKESDEYEKAINTHSSSSLSSMGVFSDESSNSK